MLAFGARLLSLAISRHREELADTSAAAIVSPDGLRKALEKLEADHTVLHHVSRATAHLWLRHAAAHGGRRAPRAAATACSTRTRRSTERIAILRQLEGLDPNGRGPVDETSTGVPVDLAKLAASTELRTQRGSGAQAAALASASTATLPPQANPAVAAPSGAPGNGDPTGHPPGWYHADAGTLRYWDGTNWTNWAAQWNGRRWVQSPREVTGSYVTTPRSRRPASSAPERPSSAASTSAVCSPTHGTRVSGPSVIFDSFTGLPGTSTGFSTPSVRGISTSMWRAATCGSAITSGARLLGPATMPAAVSSRAASSLVRVDAHASTAGRITVSRCGPQPARVAKRGSVLPLRPADELGELLELVLAHDLHDDVAVGRAEALADHLEPLVGLGPHAQRPEVGDDVGHGDHRVEHRDVDVLALAGAVAVAQRGEDADHAEQRRADVAERADRDRHRRLVGMAVVVDPRHRLDDRRVRGPVAVRRLDRVAEARDRHVDRRAGARSAITS